jgi:hypothetical protein
MITVWVKTLEEIKDRIKSNSDKQFKLAYLEDPKSNREILTLLDKDGNTIYCFLKQGNNDIISAINDWKIHDLPNVEILEGSIFLSVPIIQILLPSGFDFFSGKIYRMEIE